jgi:hypothetical protein
VRDAIALNSNTGSGLKPQQASNRRVRQRSGHSNDGGHACQQSRARKTLERVPRRPDHKHYQRLRRQGFHEPSGAE